MAGERGKQPPLVSIGLPVQNGGRLLRRALADLQAQSWPNLEIVVSDNASTDETHELLEAAAANDSRLHVSRVDHAIPVMANFHRALLAATGGLFMWAAHDDRWASDHVTRLVALLEADPAAVVAYAVPTALREDGSVIASYPEVCALALADRAERLAAFIQQPENLGKANIIYGLFRRDVLIDLDPASFFAADARRFDYHFVLAALARGRVAVDAELRFGKTAATVPPRTTFGRAVGAVHATRQIQRWLAAYAELVDELSLAPDERATVMAAVRRRRRGLVVDRLRSYRRGRARRG